MAMAGRLRRLDGWMNDGCMKLDGACRCFGFSPQEAGWREQGDDDVKARRWLSLSANGLSSGATARARGPQLDMLALSYGYGDVLLSNPAGALVERPCPQRKKKKMQMCVRAP